MPIYAYRCESCGFQKDVLQKISDAPLSQCPSCGAEAFRKQVTAAGFQLKGSGWYVTDFRSGNNGSGSGTNGAATGAKASDEGASSSPESSKPAGESTAAPAASSAPASTSSTASTTGAT